MYLFFIFLIIFLGRLNSSLLGYQFLNTDEFVIGAKAYKLINTNFYIAEFDGDTSGILNALALTWPNLLGFDVTYLSIRLTSILILSLISYSLFKTINLYLNRKLSIFLTLPFILFLSLTRDPDFLHYSNELISTLLIQISLYVYFKNFQNLRKKDCFFISFLSSLVLFAKMQFFPVACMVVFLMNIKLLFFEKQYKKIIFSSFGFIFPILFFSLYYHFNNELIDLYYNVIHYPFSDFFLRNSLSDVATIYPKNNLGSILASNKKSVFFNHLLFNSVFHLFYLYAIFIIVLFIIIKINKYNLKLLKVLSDFRFIFISIIITFTFLIIIITGSVHRHYLINLLPIIPIFIAILFNLYFNKFDQNIFLYKKNFKFIFLLPVIFLVSLLFENNKFYSKNFKSENLLFNQFYFFNPNILQYLKFKKNKNKLVVWGWKPEIYLLSGMTPATRDIINQKQLDYKSNRAYFRNRFIKDFKKNKPDIVIDYVRNNSNIFSNSQTQGVDSFIELKNELEKDYTKVVSVNISCPILYLKNDNYIFFEENRINFQIDNENNTNTYRLNDLNIDEDICDTSLFFDQNSSDDLIINLNEKKYIKEIIILSSKKNYKVVDIDILFFRDGEIVKKFKTELKRFPHTTNIIFKNSLKVDKIIINVKELKNYKFGLNEIKIY